MALLPLFPPVKAILDRLDLAHLEVQEVIACAVQIPGGWDMRQHGQAPLNEILRQVAGHLE